MRALLSSGRLAGYLSGLILLAGAAGSIATAQPRPASPALAAAEAAPAATLSAIIDRYIARRGGAAFEGLRTFQESGSLDANGNRQTLFQRPVQPHRTSFAGGAAWSGWIDFEFYDDAVIFLPVTVNGHATTAMLDSGASLSVVDRGQAAALGLATRGDISVAGAGGLASSALAKGVGFAMGDARIDGLTVLTPDFAATANSIQHEIPAVLGEEVFGELIVDVDFARRRLAFRDPKVFVKPANAIELPLVARGQLRIVPASIDGRPPGWFQFDLGDGGSLDIFPAYAAAQDLPGNHRLSQSLLYGFGGAATVSIGSLGALEFAGVKFANVPATFPSANPTTNDPGEAGRIGIEILDRFRLLIDYPDNRLYLVPTPGAERWPFYRNRLGLAMLPDDGVLVVKLVAPNSPAAAAGFHAGDRVTRLDGEPTASMTRAREREVFGAPAGTKVDIMLDGGERRTVTLADFY